MAANDRAELEELRRLDELEARAAASRSTGEQLARQVGLAARYGIEGMASLPGIVINPFQNLARSTSQRITGEPSSIKTFSEATSDALTRLGLPQEETEAEQFAGGVSRAVSSGGGSIGLARAVPWAINATTQLPLFTEAAKRVPTTVGNIFTQAPAMQAAQAGTGAAAAELTRQAGGGFWPQMLASAVAPLGVNTAVGVTKAVGRGIPELARPVTTPGAQQVAADVVGNLAVDKQAAIKRIDDWLAMRQRNLGGVPGSQPTAGAVTKDYGLIQGEQLAARGPANPDFAMRSAANNEARLNELARLRATQEQVAAFQAKRDVVTRPMRERAFANATGPVDYQPVVDRIMRLAADPRGGRVESEKALSFIADRIGKYLDEGRLSPDHAYSLHKDIGDLVKGKLTDTSGAPLRLAAGLAIDVQKVLGQQIEKVAPGFQKYLNTYFRLSRPIDRLEAITERLGGADLTRVTNPMPQAGPSGPQYTLSQAKMRNAVGDLENNLLPTTPTGLPPAPFQRDVLNRVLDDLNAETIALRGGKMPGSDTYQNMATANLLTSVFGKEIADTGMSKLLTSPLNFLYNKGGMEERIRNMINEAYLDPVKMRELLKLARTRRSLTGRDLATMSNQNIYGGLLGGAAAQP